MKALCHLNQCFIVYVVLFFHSTQAATHWVVTQDGKIQAQEDSVFQMRRPDDLIAFLEQEKRLEEFEAIRKQLLVQKQGVETDSMADNEDDVEQLVYLTNEDCLRAGKPLVKFDLYVGTLVFAYPLSSQDDHSKMADGFVLEQLHSSPIDCRPAADSLAATTTMDAISFDGSQYSAVCSNTSRECTPTQPDGRPLEEEIEEAEHVEDRARFGPNCADYLTLDFSMTTFEHLEAVRDRKDLKISPEDSIYRVIGKWKNYEEFGSDLNYGLQLNSTSWILYTLASYYWRGAGHAENAIECARRALHTSPAAYRHIPQLSLATVLHRAQREKEAAILLHGALDIGPERMPHAHYVLGNVYATLGEYNKSITCYQNTLKLEPDFGKELQKRIAAVRCHETVENALKAQHETLEKTLNELKDYQKQQELWISFHKKLRAAQASPSVQLEDRVAYREFKVKQKEQAALEAAAKGEKVSTGNKNNHKKPAPSILEERPLTLDELAEELLSPGGSKFHLTLDSVAGSSIVDQLAFELDRLEKVEQSQMSCKDRNADDMASGNNIESNDSEDSPKCPGKKGDTKRRKYH